MQSPADVSSILVQSFFDDVLTAIAAMGSTGSKCKLPDWLLAAMSRPVDDTLNGASDEVKARAKALEEILATTVDENAPQVVCTPV
jgi:hypothetical protein